MAATIPLALVEVKTRSELHVSSPSPEIWRYQLATHTAPVGGSTCSLEPLSCSGARPLEVQGGVRAAVGEQLHVARSVQLTCPCGQIEVTPTSRPTVPPKLTPIESNFIRFISTDEERFDRAQISVESDRSYEAAICKHIRGAEDDGPGPGRTSQDGDPTLGVQRQLQLRRQGRHRGLGWGLG